MAYLDTINFVVGDTMPDLRFDLKNARSGLPGVTYDPDNSDTWEPIDITDATVRLRIRAIGETDVSATIVGTISSPLEGGVIFPFTGNAFTSEGLYEGEVEITFADGGTQTMYDLVKFKVRGDFA